MYRGPSLTQKLLHALPELIYILTFLVVLTNWMKVLIFIHRKRLGLCQNDCGIDVLKFSTYAPRFCTTVT
jgi:hypothetical protein